jgi:hypothetical protein
VPLTAAVAASGPCTPTSCSARKLIPSWKIRTTSPTTAAVAAQNAHPGCSRPISAASARIAGTSSTSPAVQSEYAVSTVPGSVATACSWAG